MMQFCRIFVPSRVQYSKKKLQNNYLYGDSESWRKPKNMLTYELFIIEYLSDLEQLKFEMMDV